MKGFQISENAMGITAVKLHYSCDPAKDITHPNPATREQAQKWYDATRQMFPDENLWNQEMEVNWWVATGQRVFPEFRESIHAPGPQSHNKRKVLYRAWDFGWHAPACLIASIDSKDRLLVVREIIGHQQSTREFAQKVVDRCAEWYPLYTPGFQDFCDPAGQQVKSVESERSEKDRKSTRLNSSHIQKSRMPSSA